MMMIDDEIDINFVRIFAGLVFLGFMFQGLFSAVCTRRVPVFVRTCPQFCVGWLSPGFWPLVETHFSQIVGAPRATRVLKGKRKKMCSGEIHGLSRT